MVSPSPVLRRVEARRTRPSDPEALYDEIRHLRRFVPRPRSIPVKCLSVLLLFVLVVSGSASARELCLAVPTDHSEVILARGVIESSCECRNNSSGEFMRCVSSVAESMAEARSIRRECRSFLRATYRRSVCGRAVKDVGGGALGTCGGVSIPCITASSRGKVRCTIMPAPRCAETAEAQLCQHHSTCLDAADSNGDLRIDDHDSGLCNPFNSQFIDNEDGTITDPSSRLMWEKLSSDGSVHDVSVKYRLADARDTKPELLNAMHFAGYTDWRLPTGAELWTLYQGGANDPSVPPLFNVGCVPGCSVLECSCASGESYWSSSPFLKFRSNENVWLMGFAESGLCLGTSGLAGDPTARVRLVRTLS